MSRHDTEANRNIAHRGRQSTSSTSSQKSKNVTSRTLNASKKTSTVLPVAVKSKKKSESVDETSNSEEDVPEKEIAKKKPLADTKVLKKDATNSDESNEGEEESSTKESGDESSLAALKNKKSSKIFLEIDTKDGKRTDNAKDGKRTNKSKLVKVQPKDKAVKQKETEEEKRKGSQSTSSTSSQKSKNVTSRTLNASKKTSTVLPVAVKSKKKSESVDETSNSEEDVPEKEIAKKKPLADTKVLKKDATNSDESNEGEEESSTISNSLEAVLKMKHEHIEETKEKKPSPEAKFTNLLLPFLEQLFGEDQIVIKKRLSFWGVQGDMQWKEPDIVIMNGNRLQCILELKYVPAIKILDGTEYESIVIEYMFSLSEIQIDLFFNELAQNTYISEKWCITKRLGHLQALTLCQFLLTQNYTAQKFRTLDVKSRSERTVSYRLPLRHLMQAAFQQAERYWNAIPATRKNKHFCLYAVVGVERNAKTEIFYAKDLADSSVLEIAAATEALVIGKQVQSQDELVPRKN